MFLFTINLILCLVNVCNGASDNDLTKSENILELKSDVDKIGEGLENLAFDIVNQVMAKVNIFQVFGDYPTEDKVATPTETSTPRGITKNISEKVENNTEEYAAEKSMQISATTVESSTATIKNVSEIRSKRSANGVVVEKTQAQSSTCDINKCPEKTLKEQVLEQKHIEDLKDEVNKLYDLVLLLRDQQKVISLLREETSHTENDLPKRFSARNLLKVLDHVSNKDVKKDSVWGRKSTEIVIEPDGATGKKVTHEELENIKNDLRGAIAALNKTETILAMQKEKGVYLENQLKDQKLQINFLNAMVLRLYRDNPNVSIGKENFTLSRDELLGAAMHLPKELPVPKMSRKKVNDANEMNETTSDGQGTDQASRIREYEGADQEQGRHFRARGRASELEDLERLLEQISKPKKNDMESKMLELQKEMEKKKHGEDLLNQLIMLQKLLARQKENKSLNAASSSESELIKRLQIATAANKNKPESKLIDDDVESELQKLQVAINNLRPEDQWEFVQDDLSLNERPKIDSEIFRQMLLKLLKQSNSNMVYKGPQLPPKVIGKVENEKIVSGETTLFPLPNSDASYGYGYGPLGIFRRLPPFPAQPSSRWYGNTPYYPPFGSLPYQAIMNRMLNNNYGMYGAPSNAEYNGYFAPAGNMPPISYLDQNFGPPPFKPMSTATSQHNFEANMDLNTYGSPNFNQKHPRNPITPPPYIYGAMEQNSYQIPSDMYPTNQHNFGISIDQQGSSDASQRPYTQSLPPNQYNFGSNMDQNSYQDSHLIITGQNGYNKPLDQGSKMLPYHEEGSKNIQGYKETEIKTHFFPIFPPNTFQKSMSNGFYSQATAAGESSGQSGTYSQHDTGNVDYRHQKIEDLKRQVYSLQNIINDLNKPDYTQKPEDKETVANLERQISELNGIINGLSQDVTPNKPNYLPNNPQSVPRQQPTNFEKSSRRRRSLTGNQIDPDEDSKLYDQVVSKVKQLFFEKDNQTEERSSYNDVQRKIADLKSRKPYGIPKDWIRTFI